MTLAKAWINGSGGGTPLSAAAMIDMETRIQAEIEARVLASLGLSGEAAKALSATSSKAVHPVDVRDKGAVGDGSTDDTAAFLRAEEAVPAEGGAIYVPGGYVFNLKSEWVPTRPAMRVYGDGWNQATPGSGSVIRAGAAMTNLIKSTGAAFHLDHISLNGVGNAENVLLTEGLNSQVFQAHVRQPKTGGTCIRCSGESPWVTNCRVNGANQENSIGIVANSTDGIFAFNKPVNLLYGYELTGNASGTQIEGGHVTTGTGTNVGKHAVFVNGNPNRFAINKLRVDNHAKGAAIQISPTANIRTVGIHGLIVYQNIIENEAWPVIGVDTSSANVYGLNITGAEVESATSHVYASFIDAIKASGEAATNAARLETAGTVCMGNTAYAKKFFGEKTGAAVKVMVGKEHNTLATEGTNFAVA